MPKGKTMANKWDEQPTGPEDSVLPQLAKNHAKAPAPAEKPYVHTPGTVHLNAYLADVAEAEAKLSQAKTELAAAQERLQQKKQESGMI